MIIHKCLKKIDYHIISDSSLVGEGGEIVFWNVSTCQTLVRSSAHILLLFWNFLQFSRDCWYYVIELKIINYCFDSGGTSYHTPAPGRPISWLVTKSSRFFQRQVIIFTQSAGASLPYCLIFKYVIVKVERLQWLLRGRPHIRWLPLFKHEMPLPFKILRRH